MTRRVSPLPPRRIVRVSPGTAVVSTVILRRRDGASLAIECGAGDEATIAAVLRTYPALTRHEAIEMLWAFGGI